MIHCPFLSVFDDYNNTLDSKIPEVCSRAIDNMTAWLMAHGPIPSFQKYLLDPVGTRSSFKPWLGLWEISTGSREFDRKTSGRPADLPLNQFCNLDGSGMIWIYLSPKGCFFVFLFGAPGCL